MGWLFRHIRYHGTRHPAELGEAEIDAYLTHLADERRLSRSTQMQALSALALLCREGLALLLYGAGLRLLECLTLRVKDSDVARGEIRVRRGKGGEDRVTMLPAIARPELEQHFRLGVRSPADRLGGE